MDKRFDDTEIATFHHLGEIVFIIYFIPGTELPVLTAFYIHSHMYT